VAAEDGDDGVINLILSEVTERLDEAATDPACCVVCRKGGFPGVFHFPPEKLPDPHHGEGVEFAVFEELVFERELVGAAIPAEVKTVLARS